MVLTVQMRVLMRWLPLWDDEVLFSEEFVELMKERMRSDVDVFLDSAEEWRALECLV